MPKRDIMSALNRTPDGKLPKNAYDLHFDTYSTSKMGQYLPVGCIETVPDGIYKVGVDNFTFTLPCNTASMADMKENYYFLFVPYSQIINSAYSFFPQRQDLQSALDYSYEKVPFFDLGSVVYRCILWAVKPSEISGTTFDIHNHNIGLGALKLLDLLGYGCYLDLWQWVDEVKNDATKLADRLNAVYLLCTNKLNTYKPNILRIAAYQKTWYCYFRNIQYDTSWTPRCFNFDDVVYHEAGVSVDYNVLHHRDIDNFIRECLQMRYVQYKKDVFTASMPGTQYGAVSSVQTLGSDVSVSGSVSISGTTGTDFTRWRLAGTGSQESMENTDSKNVYSGNLATVDKRTDPSDPTVTQQPGSLFTVGQTLLEDDVNYDKLPMQHDHTFSGTGSLQNGSLSGIGLFDVLKLVEAQAIQKWRQKSMLAGQRAQNQYKAHYGVVPKHLEDHYPDFFGSVDNYIDIDKLINSANTAADGYTNLGDLGGRGVGASDKRKFTYHAKEHGVIIICRSIVPENVYSSFGLDRANQLINYTDFWQPEFQNIGLETVPKTLLDVTGVYDGNYQNIDHQSSTLFKSQGLVLGFAPRNYQLKAYPSKVHGTFNPTRLVQLGLGDDSDLPYGFKDIMMFAMSRADMTSRMRAVTIEGASSLMTYDINYTLQKFYVSPNLADNTFVLSADGSEVTDQFMHKCTVLCEALQPLTPLGLPQF